MRMCLGERWQESGAWRVGCRASDAHWQSLLASQLGLNPRQGMPTHAQKQNEARSLCHKRAKTPSRSNSNLLFPPR